MTVEDPVCRTVDCGRDYIYMYIKINIENTYTYDILPCI